MTEAENSPFTKQETDVIRKRQAARSKVMGLVLVGLCVLFFLITVVKIGVWS
jgi:hypothetical protein